MVLVVMEDHASTYTTLKRAAWLYAVTIAFVSGRADPSPYRSEADFRIVFLLKPHKDSKKRKN